MAYRVSDLSVDELRDIIRETVTKTLLDLFQDPDKNLELQDGIRREIQLSLDKVQSGSDIYPVETIAKKLGLNW